MVKYKDHPLKFAMKSKLKLILIFLIVLAIGYASYKGFVAPQSEEKKETAKVKRGDLKEILVLSGEIDAEEKVNLRFQTSGFLSWVGVKQGDYVKKYQLVAQLDQRELKKKLDKYLNDFLEERWDFDQTREDYEDMAITTVMQRIIDKAQFGVNKAVLDVEIQDLAIQFSRLITPIEGIVTRVDSAYAGVNITPTRGEIEVVNPQTVYFSALADQTEVVKLRQGLSSELVLDSYPDKTFSGKVTNISFAPKAGETGTVYEVRLAFNDDNSDYKYRLGMTGDVEFTTKQKDSVLYLPLKFVKEEEGKVYVTTKTNGKMTKVEVKTGLETEDLVEIKSGLSEGDVIYD